MSEHMPCYGKICPSNAWRQSGKDRSDAVFGYVFQQAGIATRAPEITVDLAAWDHCLQCPDFSNCHQLSVAKLLLEMAVRN